MKKYPDIKLVGNSKTFTFLPQFFDIQNLDSKKIEVKEGENLDLGNHKIKFIMAPMVQWPEVMMTYEEKEWIYRSWPDRRLTRNGNTPVLSGLSYCCI